MSEIMDVDDRFSDEEDTLDAILWAIHSGRLPRAEPNEADQDTARVLLEHYTELVEERVSEELGLTYQVLLDFIELGRASRAGTAVLQKELLDAFNSRVIPMVVESLAMDSDAGAPTITVADAYEHERRRLPSVDG